MSDPGFAYGAAVSWCLEANRDLDLVGALSAHAYDDAACGIAGALMTLGDAHRAVTPQIPNHSILALHLYFPQVRVGHGISTGLRAAELDEVARRVDDALADVARSRPRRADAALLGEEVRWTADVLSLLTDDARARVANGDGTLASVPERVRAGLASRLDTLIERARALWLARNRPGGLDDSLRWLRHLHDAYVTGRPERGWAGWPDAFC